jgi:hypothetical protein
MLSFDEIKSVETFNNTNIPMLKLSYCVTLLRCVEDIVNECIIQY